MDIENCGCLQKSLYEKIQQVLLQKVELQQPLAVI
jgi:hypothetical protein